MIGKSSYYSRRRGCCWQLWMLVVFGFASTRTTNCQRLHQSFLREPFDQIATVGEHVTLPCRVVNKQGVLQWTRDDFGLGSERELIGFSRYAMTGSDEEGDWTLDIDPVILEDDAEFQCQVGAADPGIEPIRSRYATLSVLVPPDKPRIIPHGTHHKTVEGRKVELRCESRGGKPAAEITWFDDNNEVIEEGVRTRTELMEDGKRYVTISVLKFVAKTQHHNANFTCQAQNSAIRQPQSVSTRLQVHYPPHVTLTSDQGDFVEEGTQVRFRCEADANPMRQLTYAWYVGGRRATDSAISGGGTELLLDHVDRRLHNHVVKCEVTNPIGKTEESTILNVAYPPMFIKRPVSLAGDRDERVTLSCLVDSNPAPAYSWYRLQPSGKPPRLVGNSANLSLIVSPSTVGEYVCKASTVHRNNRQEEEILLSERGQVEDKGGESSVVASLENAAAAQNVISAVAKVYLKSKPRILPDKRVQFASLKTIGRVVCEAVSVPTVETVEWFYSGGLPVMTGNGGKFSVLENRSNDGVRSTLVIAGVQNQDLGSYTCRVTNAMGTDSAVFSLQQQVAVSLVVVLAGVLGGLFLTVAIIMTIVVCRRHHQATCTAKLNASSDIVVISKKKSKNDESGLAASAEGGGGGGERGVGGGGGGVGLGSASTASTTNSDADGASNDSSEMNKVEVRTSSSLSQPADDVDGLGGSGNGLVGSWMALEDKTKNNNHISSGNGSNSSAVSSAVDSRLHVLGGSGGRQQLMVESVHGVHSNVHGGQQPPPPPPMGSSSNYTHVHNNFNKSASSISANYSLSPPMPSTGGVPSYISAAAAAGSTSSYYGSNLANYGNYGSYNPAYNSSPSSAGTAAAMTSGGNASYHYGHHHHGLPTGVATTVPPPGSSSVVDGGYKSSESLYVTQADAAAAAGSSQADKQSRYSVHVRASPISPTYSQFSNGVSVKNCYPPAAGGGYEAATAAGKNSCSSNSNTLVRAAGGKPSRLLHHPHSHGHEADMVDNYSVYVNSTSAAAAGPSSTAVRATAASSAVTSVTAAPPSAANSSLATHV